MIKTKCDLRDFIRCWSRNAHIRRSLWGDFLYRGCLFTKKILRLKKYKLGHIVAPPLEHVDFLLKYRSLSLNNCSCSWFPISSISVVYIGNAHVCIGPNGLQQLVKQSSKLVLQISTKFQSHFIYRMFNRCSRSCKISQMEALN